MLAKPLDEGSIGVEGIGQLCELPVADVRRLVRRSYPGRSGTAAAPVRSGSRAARAGECATAGASRSRRGRQRVLRPLVGRRGGRRLPAQRPCGDDHGAHLCASGWSRRSRRGFTDRSRARPVWTLGGRYRRAAPLARGARRPRRTRRPMTRHLTAGELARRTVNIHNANHQQHHRLASRDQAAAPRT